jgi:hypothetical protein
MVCGESGSRENNRSTETRGPKNQMRSTQHHHRARTSRRAHLVRSVAVLLALSSFAVRPVSPAVAATALRARVDLRLLVVTDRGPAVDALTTQLAREGVPFDVVDLGVANRPKVTAAFLSDTVSGVPRAKYQGVILPNENPFPADTGEMAALTSFESRFSIRQVDAFTWAHPGVGLNYAGYVGTVDGMTGTVTAAGKAGGFGYLTGTVRLDDIDPAVAESYGYLATPLAVAPTGSSFQPLVTAPVPGTAAAGSLLGVYAHDSREELVVTMSTNQFQTQARVLGRGIVNWLTRGIHLGYSRNWFSLHVDDVFLGDDRWNSEANCTVGDNCNLERDPNVSPYNEPSRMTPADVDRLVAWQNTQGIKLDLAFNGSGSVEAIADGGADPLTAKLLERRNQFRWINHTYSHPFLGCVQDFSVVPWRCAVSPTGQIAWVSQATIQSEISDNVAFARRNGITLDSRELVTGEHSGLRSLPQMPGDNPNLSPAFTRTGVRVVAADASRESATRMVGPALAMPRYPMNIFYNAATAAEEADEYNWIYTRRADGGSGTCESNTATTTCISPLPVDTGFASYIVPLEARIALGHVLTGDPRPHYAHQSNITEDRILYPVLDQMLSRYRSLFAANTPLLNPRMSESGDQLFMQQTWGGGADRTVEAYLFDGVVKVTNRGTSRSVPITVPLGTRVSGLLGLPGAQFGQPYAGGQSAWQSLSKNQSITLRVG